MIRKGIKKSVILAIIFVLFCANLCFFNTEIWANSNKSGGTKIKSIVNIPNNSVNVVIQNQNVDQYVEKYQIMYSTSSKFKNNKKKKLTVMYVGADTVMGTVKNLKKNKKYYFKVRAYVDGKYGDWSDVKSVKVKKTSMKSSKSTVITLNKKNTQKILCIDLKYDGDYRHLKNYIDLKVEVLDATGTIKSSSGNSFGYYSSEVAKGSLLYECTPKHFQKGSIWYPDNQILKKDDGNFAGNIIIEFDLPKGMSKLKLKVTATTKTGNKIIKMMQGI